ncbi:MAG TPA: TIGR03086 family metal-binding protein [Candidatus Dormibacteraeota bacterium]|nr:TIGR03086 family metal-binding protein [Candidatus Dormibacteraeota bacterium]
MSEESTRYSRVAAGFRSRLDAVPENRWDAPSPCDEWSARAVVAHSALVHRNVASMVRPELRQGTVHDDPPTAWHQASDLVAAALDDSGLSGVEVQTRAGHMSFAELVATLLCADTLVHTWDLARATGLDEGLDPEAVAAAYAYLAPRGEQMRVPGGFGPEVDPPPGADPQTRFLCFTGRRP